MPLQFVSATLLSLILICGFCGNYKQNSTSSKQRIVHTHDSEQQHDKISNLTQRLYTVKNWLRKPNIKQVQKHQTNNL